MVCEKILSDDQKKANDASGCSTYQCNYDGRIERKSIGVESVQNPV